MTTEQIRLIKEMYQPGVRIRLTSMYKEPQMPEGLTGEVEHVDDDGQIHTRWSNGSGLALRCEVDEFIAFSGPTAAEYLHGKYPPDASIWIRESIPGCTRAVLVNLDRLITDTEARLEKIIGMTTKLAALLRKPYETVSVFEDFISGHVLSDEQARELNQKREFSETESLAGHCPKCGSDMLSYGVLEIIDNFVKHPWVCKACGSEGNEFGAIVFDGHEVTGSPGPKTQGGAK